MATVHFSPSIKDHLASEPSSWDLFLLNEGLNERNCASLLKGRSRQGRAIRTWVLKHYTKKYVPEDILELLGLRGQLRLRWQGDE
jgi:hypothetical protein